MLCFFFLARGGGASVAKTLDLLKAVLQSSFNSEVKRLCDDYLHIFTLAAVNIRENTGDNVPEATIKLLVCKMLEEVGKNRFVCLLLVELLGLSSSRHTWAFRMTGGSFLQAR